MTWEEGLALAAFVLLIAAALAAPGVRRRGVLPGASKFDRWGAASLAWLKGLYDRGSSKDDRTYTQPPPPHS
ncbi:MAG: hypothetical protein K2V38_28840 [Gemmataceae bacterium]|nr:hypothetical protein [Gemmataceae bacterium]